MLPDLALWLTLISSNYLCLEDILMVPKVFEPLKFYCIALIIICTIILAIPGWHISKRIILAV